MELPIRSVEDASYDEGSDCEVEGMETKEVGPLFDPLVGITEGVKDFGHATSCGSACQWMSNV